ncbi:hypothetical protein OJAV_G00118860 [Oryzias javanicus]|uniref:Uncharacterized protein n=1 Tax=Oryzias javanicus TaxID=123683 RepID=A0A3S2P3A1_ORYJA|nr:hypothetical protein OJAV_G00118860 [Oryzias javanicus]
MKLLLKFSLSIKGDSLGRYCHANKGRVKYSPGAQRWAETHTDREEDSIRGHTVDLYSLRRCGAVHLSQTRRPHEQRHTARKQVGALKEKRREHRSLVERVVILPVSPSVNTVLPLHHPLE